MYNWRNISPSEREELLNERKAKGFPWHSPPHLQSDLLTYFISAACYQHTPIIGNSKTRMASFSQLLLDTMIEKQAQIHAWCVLPNHYHILLKCENLKDIIKSIGLLHGKTSYNWNSEENQRGRRVWYRCADRSIQTERHFWATMNYIHNNPVHHRYVDKWQNWPFSSTLEFIEKMGYEKVLEIWKSYPLKDYGKKWDESDM